MTVRPSDTSALTAQRKCFGPPSAAIGFCLFVLSLLGGSPSALSYDLMLDVSGSMKGFSSYPQWRQLLDSLQGGADGTWVFGAKARRYEGSLSSAPLNEAKTELGTALQTWLRSDNDRGALVMVTDNVADDQAESSAQQQLLFYSLLMDASDLIHIAMTPLRLPFSGAVYHPFARGISADYSGDRALAVYLMTRRGYPDARLAELQQKLASLGGDDRPYIVVRPFAEQGWGESIQDAEIQVGGASAAATRIQTNSEGIAIHGYSVGDPLDFTIGATVRPGPNFLLRDVRLSTDIQFEEVPNMRTAQLDSVKITPNVTELSPEQERRFTLDYKIDGFQLTDLGFRSLLDLALRGSSWQNGAIVIQFNVERGKIDLVGPISRQWDFSGSADLLATPDPAVQSRIYRFNDLVRGMIPEDQLSKRIWSKPVWVQVAYPLGPLLLLILLALVLLGLLYLLARYLAKGSRYQVEDDGGSITEIAPTLASSVTVPSSDGAIALKILNLGLFHWHGSTGRLLSSRLVSAGRAVARIESPGKDEAPGHRYRFVVSKLAAKKERQDDDEGEI